MTMIDKPYVTASRIPFLRSSFALLRKKLTVIGMIGHTQGVSKAMKPPKTPIKKILQRELLVLSLVLLKADNSLITGCHKLTSAFTCAFSCFRAPAVSAGNTSDFFAVSAVIAVSADKPSAATSVAAVVVLSVSALAAVGVAAGAEAGPLPLKLNSTCVGGKHISSLQAPYSK